MQMRDSVCEAQGIQHRWMVPRGEPEDGRKVEPGKSQKVFHAMMKTLTSVL